MGILGKLLPPWFLVSIWCLVIVEPGQVRKEQDHLGKSSFYCISALSVSAPTSLDFVPGRGVSTDLIDGPHFPGNRQPNFGMINRGAFKTESYIARSISPGGI